MRQELSPAIEDYILWRRSQDLSKSTLRNERVVLNRFLSVNGNIFTHNISQRHVTRHFEDASRNRAPQTLRIDHNVLNGFFQWARHTKRMTQDNDPMYGRRKPKVTKKERNRIHVSKFAHLLDVAEENDPRNRALVAVMLYTLLRDNEATDLKVGDVDLAALDLRCRISKTREEDTMPISSELDAELRKWLTYYTVAIGRPLKPTDYLIPARMSAEMKFSDRGRITGHEWSYRPERRITGAHKVVTPILEAAGIPLVDHAGQTLREGAHTLRRSGARAFFDQLVLGGYDHALRVVQSMLHHSSMATTEGYLGLTADRRTRDEIVRGKPMYATGEVISLAERIARTGG